MRAAERRAAQRGNPTMEVVYRDDGNEDGADVVAVTRGLGGYSAAGVMP